jgi:5,10-methenyltetrahydrofolate synthetase
MIGESDDHRPATYTSPPCVAHEIDAIYEGPGAPAQPQQRANVMRWRKAERERLIKERLAIPSTVRRRHAEQIAARLKGAIGDVQGKVVSAYWPFRGEPDLRALLGRFEARGGRTALPMVISRGQPLVFRVWAPGGALEPGVWNIPVPTDDAEVVAPDVVIAPLVGFDPACYRLGHGGGFFDRTLAAAPNRPRVFGVGYAQAALPTIHPLPHDIPMDVIVTENSAVSRAPLQDS